MCSVLNDALRSYRRQCDLVIKVVIDDHVNLGLWSVGCILFEGSGSTSNNTILQGWKQGPGKFCECVCFKDKCISKYVRADFPDGTVEKNPPANAGERGLGVGEDPTCCGANKPMCYNHWACALEPESHSEPTCCNCWLLCALEPALHSKRSRRSEKPMRCRITLGCHD